MKCDWCKKSCDSTVKHKDATGREFNICKECDSKRIEGIRCIAEVGLVCIPITKQEYVNVIDWLMTNYNFEEDNREGE